MYVIKKNTLNRMIVNEPYLVNSTAFASGTISLLKDVVCRSGNGT